jgi:hypothetical protein
VRPRGDETVVNLRSREDVVAASLVLNGLERRPGENDGEDVEDLGNDGSEPEEAKEKVSHAEGGKGGENVAPRDLEVGREASAKENASEAPDGEGGSVGACSQQGTREETISGSAVNEVGQEIVEPRHRTWRGRGKKGQKRVSKGEIFSTWRE